MDPWRWQLLLSIPRALLLLSSLRAGADPWVDGWVSLGLCLVELDEIPKSPGVNGLIPKSMGKKLFLHLQLGERQGFHLWRSGNDPGILIPGWNEGRSRDRESGGISWQGIPVLVWESLSRLRNPCA